MNAVLSSLPDDSSQKPIEEAATVLGEEFFILGLTDDDQVFRPSDWAERLCGVLATALAEAEGSPLVGQRSRCGVISYSIYAKPVVVAQLKCVAVRRNLATINPMAYRFLLNFAADNKLQTTDACSIGP